MPSPRRFSAPDVCRMFAEQPERHHPRPFSSISKAPHMQGFLGAPGATRTRDLWFRRPTLYPTELQAHTGGEGGIRTLERRIHSFTRLAGERLQPLGHFSLWGGEDRRLSERLF